jgi:hypothetical protein
MRKVKKITKKQTIETTVDIICNKCGETCSNLKRFHNASQHQMCGFSGLNEIEVHGGYDSQFIGDMTSWRFSLCEKCLSQIVKSFKIPHEVKGENSSEYVPAPKYEALSEKAAVNNKKEWVKAILELDPSQKRSALEKKNFKILYDLYYKLKS